MHVQRTMRLAGGEALSAITADVCQALDVGARIVPMSDQPVRTKLLSDDGWLEFQDYFVRQRAQPVVRAIVYAGHEAAQPPPGLLELVCAPDLDAIIICPSNPLISVEPILAVPGIEAAMAQASAPVVAVSPIIAGQAVKGPTAKMLGELGIRGNGCDGAQALCAPARRFRGGPAGHSRSGGIRHGRDPVCGGRHDVVAGRPRAIGSDGVGGFGIDQAGRGRCGCGTSKGGRRMSGMWIIVPVKDTRFSKQRLSGVLSQTERQKLGAYHARRGLECGRAA